MARLQTDRPLYFSKSLENKKIPNPNFTQHSTIPHYFIFEKKFPNSMGIWLRAVWGYGTKILDPEFEFGFGRFFVLYRSCTNITHAIPHSLLNFLHNRLRLLVHSYVSLLQIYISARGGNSD